MAGLDPKTVAIIRATLGESTGEAFPALTLKNDTPEAPKRVAAQLQQFAPAAQSHDCKPHAGMAEAPAPTINPVTVTPICDTGPLVRECIREGMQMAIDMMQAVTAMQSGYTVPESSQFQGNRLP